MCTSFLVMGVSSNFNAADDHMIQLETDIKIIFCVEHGDEDFTALQQNILLMLQQINKILMEQYDSYKHFC